MNWVVVNSGLRSDANRALGLCSSARRQRMSGLHGEVASALNSGCVEVAEKQRAELFWAVPSLVDERQQRKTAGAAARMLGLGGPAGRVRLVSRLSPRTPIVYGDWMISCLPSGR